MGASYNETLREAEEESGLMRGGARFRQDKRQRIGEGPAVIETQYHEGIPHRKKRPYSEDEREQTKTMPRVEEISNPNNTIHMPPRTMSQSRRNASSTPSYPTC